MARLEDHPTVLAVRGRPRLPQADAPLDAEWLRCLCLEAGADDVGFVEIERPELADERKFISAVFPQTRTLISFVCRMNREPVRRVQRSVANVEFHHVGHEVNDVAHRIVAALEREGVKAVNPPMAFPMEADRWPGRMWLVSHKPLAVAAGLGMMGIHRNVIHPKFGNFILLGTVLLESRVSEHSRPTSFNPCLECKLCVAACPVGAIKPDGQFDLASCYTHNYREFMGGFGDWAEHVADAKNGKDLRTRVTPAEQVSMWQSLGFGPNYKSGYCIAVCPAGEDVIGPFLADRGGFVSEVVKPLQQNTEPVYVVPNSDAEGHVTKRFPHKRVRRVRGSLLPSTIAGFLFAIRVVFQREQSAGLSAVYHFTFAGSESAQATVTIRDMSIDVQPGHNGAADCSVTADADTWLGFLRKEKSIVWAIVRRKVKVKGPLRLLTAFGRCFPT
jgi:epoxyqueuosine reductase QueG